MPFLVADSWLDKQRKRLRTLVVVGGARMVAYISCKRCRASRLFRSKMCFSTLLALFSVPLHLVVSFSLGNSQGFLKVLHLDKALSTRTASFFLHSLYISCNKMPGLAFPIACCKCFPFSPALCCLGGKAGCGAPENCMDLPI
jgi:hypothetical protein